MMISDVIALGSKRLLFSLPSLPGNARAIQLTTDWMPRAEAGHDEL